MANPQRSATSDRPPLSRERVLAAAIELADGGGVEALSMRKLAAHLGFEAMSLYNHVRNKDDLLDAILDEVYGELTPPSPDVDWKHGVRQLAIDTHDMLLRHSWAASLIPDRFPGDHRLRFSETVLDLLGRGHFDDDLRDLGFHAITLHIAGFTQQQLSYTMTPERRADGMARFARDVTRDRFPLMVDHVDYHIERDRDPERRPDEFAFVLDLILDGLERRRDGA
jgi:AcrR family transcriptional regulator